MLPVAYLSPLPPPPGHHTSHFAVPPGGTEAVTLQAAPAYYPSPLASARVLAASHSHSTAPVFTSYAPQTSSVFAQEYLLDPHQRLVHHVSAPGIITAGTAYHANPFITGESSRQSSSGFPGSRRASIGVSLTSGHSAATSSGYQTRGVASRRRAASSSSSSASHPLARLASQETRTVSSNTSGTLSSSSPFSVGQSRNSIFARTTHTIALQGASSVRLVSRSSSPGADTPSEVVRSPNTRPPRSSGASPTLDRARSSSRSSGRRFMSRTEDNAVLRAAERRISDASEGARRTTGSDRASHPTTSRAAHIATLSQLPDQHGERNSSPPSPLSFAAPISSAINGPERRTTTSPSSVGVSSGPRNGGILSGSTSLPPLPPVRPARRLAEPAWSTFTARSACETRRRSCAEAAEARAAALQARSPPRTINTDAATAQRTTTGGSSTSRSVSRRRPSSIPARETTETDHAAPSRAEQRRRRADEEDPSQQHSAHWNSPHGRYRVRTAAAAALHAEGGSRARHAERLEDNSSGSTTFRDGERSSRGRHGRRQVEEVLGGSQPSAVSAPQLSSRSAPQGGEGSHHGVYGYIVDHTVGVAANMNGVSIHPVGGAVMGVLEQASSSANLPFSGEAGQPVLRHASIAGTAGTSGVTFHSSSVHGRPGTHTSTDGTGAGAGGHSSTTATTTTTTRRRHSAMSPAGAAALSRLAAASGWNFRPHQYMQASLTQPSSHSGAEGDSTQPSSRVLFTSHSAVLAPGTLRGGGAHVVVAQPGQSTGGGHGESQVVREARRVTRGREGGPPTEVPGGVSRSSTASSSISGGGGGGEERTEQGRDQDVWFQYILAPSVSQEGVGRSGGTSALQLGLNSGTASLLQQEGSISEHQGPTTATGENPFTYASSSSPSLPSVTVAPDGTIVVENFTAQQLVRLRQTLTVAAQDDEISRRRGLSPRILHWLPEERFRARRGHLMSEELRECLICRMEYEENETLRRLPCLHAFHSECVERWLQEHTSCPLCRFEVLNGLRWELSSPPSSRLRSGSTPAALSSGTRSPGLSTTTNNSRRAGCHSGGTGGGTSTPSSSSSSAAQAPLSLPPPPPSSSTPPSSSSVEREAPAPSPPLQPSPSHENTATSSSSESSSSSSAAPDSYSSSSLLYFVRCPPPPPTHCVSFSSHSHLPLHSSSSSSLLTSSCSSSSSVLPSSADSASNTGPFRGGKQMTSKFSHSNLPRPPVPAVGTSLHPDSGSGARRNRTSPRDSTHENHTGTGGREGSGSVLLAPATAPPRSLGGDTVPLDSEPSSTESSVPPSPSPPLPQDASTHGQHPTSSGDGVLATGAQPSPDSSREPPCHHMEGIPLNLANALGLLLSSPLSRGSAEDYQRSPAGRGVTLVSSPQSFDPPNASFPPAAIPSTRIPGVAPSSSLYSLSPFSTDGGTSGYGDWSTDHPPHSSFSSSSSLDRQHTGGREVSRLQRNCSGLPSRVSGAAPGQGTSEPSPTGGYRGEDTRVVFLPQTNIEEKGSLSAADSQHEPREGGATTEARRANGQETQRESGRVGGGEASLCPSMTEREGKEEPSHAVPIGSEKTRFPSGNGGGEQAMTSSLDINAFMDEERTCTYSLEASSSCPSIATEHVSISLLASAESSPVASSSYSSSSFSQASPSHQKVSSGTFPHQAVSSSIRCKPREETPREEQSFSRSSSPRRPGPVPTFRRAQSPPPLTCPGTSAEPPLYSPQPPRVGNAITRDEEETADPRPETTTALPVNARLSSFEKHPTPEQPVLAARSGGSSSSSSSPSSSCSSSSSVSSSRLVSSAVTSSPAAWPEPPVHGGGKQREVSDRLSSTGEGESARRTPRFEALSSSASPPLQQSTLPQSRLRTQPTRIIASTTLLSSKGGRDGVEEGEGNQHNKCPMLEVEKEEEREEEEEKNEEEEDEGVVLGSGPRVDDIEGSERKFGQTDDPAWNVGRRRRLSVSSFSELLTSRPRHPPRDQEEEWGEGFGGFSTPGVRDSCLSSRVVSSPPSGRRWRDQTEWQDSDGASRTTRELVVSRQETSVADQKRAKDVVAEAKEEVLIRSPFLHTKLVRRHPAEVRKEEEEEEEEENKKRKEEFEEDGRRLCMRSERRRGPPLEEVERTHFKVMDEEATSLRRRLSETHAGKTKLFSANACLPQREKEHAVDARVVEGADSQQLSPAEPSKRREPSRSVD